MVSKKVLYLLRPLNCREPLEIRQCVATTLLAAMTASYTMSNNDSNIVKYTRIYRILKYLLLYVKNVAIDTYLLIYRSSISGCIIMFSLTFWLLTWHSKLMNYYRAAITVNQSSYQCYVAYIVTGVRVLAKTFYK